MQTSGNTILITGGGSGIGYELARRFVQLNNQVIICGRNADKLRRASGQLGNIPYFTCDITRSEDIQQMQREIATQYPGINMLVNNAGVAYPPVPGSGLSAYDRASLEMETNYLSMVRLNETFLPLLLTQPRAAVIHLSSVVALVPSTWLATYSASKAAIHSYSMTLRNSLENTAVRVFEAMPPLVDTDLTAPIKSGRKMNPSQVAAEIISAVEKDRYEIHVGVTRMLSLLNRLSPSLAHALMKKAL